MFSEERHLVGEKIDGFFNEILTDNWENRAAVPVILFSVLGNRAKQLLTYTDLRIQEIAMQCGYNNESHFMRQFRERIGMRAVQYRTKTKKWPVCFSQTGHILFGIICYNRAVPGVGSADIRYSKAPFWRSALYWFFLACWRVGSFIFMLLSILFPHSHWISRHNMI